MGGGILVGKSAKSVLCQPFSGRPGIMSSCEKRRSQLSQVLLCLDISQLAVEIEEVIFHMPSALNYLAEIHVK